MDSEAFMQLLDETVSYIKKAHGLSNKNRWIQSSEAKNILGLTSNTTLQKLRDEGKIRFSQPMHKVILYDRESIMEYLDHHAKNTF
jgi:hypothetical protein